MKPRKNKQVVIHPLMFSVYPVVFLYSSNREVFDFSIVAVPVALNLALALVVWWVIHRLTSDIKRSALYTSLLLFGASVVRGKSRHRTVSLDRSMSYGLFCPGTI